MVRKDGERRERMSGMYMWEEDLLNAMQVFKGVIYIFSYASRASFFLLALIFSFLPFLCSPLLFSNSLY